jgi:hypothetical protein
MEISSQTFSEWNASDLRPVAHWIPTVDESGRSRLVMRWLVPDLESALDQTTAALTRPSSHRFS